MLKHIKLERFRGFNFLETDLRPATVVVGRNSSGKTSVLHAIRMGIEALRIAHENGAHHLDDDGWITVCWDLLVSDHERLFPVAEWSDLFTDKQVGEGTSMRVELTFDETDTIQAIHAEFSYARNYQLKMRVRVEAEAVREKVAELPKKSKFRRERLVELLDAGLPMAVFVPPFYGAPRDEEFRSWQVVRRRLGGGDQGRIVRNVIARLNSNELMRLNDFLRRAGMGAVVERTPAQDADAHQYLHVTFRDTNGELELSSAGAGFVNLVALYGSMVRFAAERPVVYLLDEPEAHLHPKLQGDIGLELAKMAAEFGAQLVIATHSVEMINRLHQRHDSVLIAVDRTSTTATVLDSHHDVLRELAQWADLTPFASINFLSKKQVLFHEGTSDETIIKRCAEIYYRNQSDKLLHLSGWTFVPLNGSGNANSQAVLGAVLNPALFPHLTPKEPVRAICVLDRDAERIPGFRAEKSPAGGAFQAHTMVWSRHSIESLFVTPNILTAWLMAILPRGAVNEGVLRQLVEDGIAKADTDSKLIMEATGQRMLYHLRAKRHEDGTKSQLVAPDALNRAHEEVAGSPDIWQRGKDRVAAVLRHVRENISSETVATNVLKNALVSSIVGLVDAASIDRVGDPIALIPEEIRTLLDRMVSPGSSTASS